jgi:hypothetical protein
MSRALEILLTDLRYLIADLGRDGGQIGPSVYNTAQHLRLAPPAEGVWPAVEWLVKQQHGDGGWGSPTMIMARDVPTLAAVLALHSVGGRKYVREAVSGGMTFLRRHAAMWSETLPDDIPVGVELILPVLLDEAALAGLPVPEPLHYTALRKLGERRRTLIGRLEPRGGSTASHSWEAWGTRPDPALLDESGGVGHSPAATAAWLRAAAERADLAGERAAATEYLRQACLATSTGLPGVAPGVWPYPRNEQTVSLFTLFLAGLLDEPALESSLAPQVADLWQGLRPEGQGISDWFSTDGDITAMCFAVAHNLCAQRTLERLWDGDKWHASWTYITGHTISALLAAGRSDEAMAALPAILDRQKPNGSWGETEARDEETANVVIALLDIDRREGLPEQARGALSSAAGWLMRHYRPLREETGACWIGKELYRPRRIARTLQLAALLSCVRGGYVSGAEN